MLVLHRLTGLVSANLCIIFELSFALDIITGIIYLNIPQKEHI